MPHELKLTQGALFAARTVLKQPGWAKTIDRIMLGGQLLVDVLPDHETAPELGTRTPTVDQVKTHNAAWAAWSRSPIDAITLKDKQRDALKAAVEYNIKEAGSGASEELYRLMIALGFDQPAEDAK